MPAGRPSSYKPEYAGQAEKLCRLGATDIELADFFGVERTTIWRWSNQFEEFCNALKTGKEAADERVQASLYHKAIGYTFESEKVFQHQGEIVRAPVREHVAPDTTAAIFWLKNRKPAEWRDKVDHEHTGKDGAALIPEETDRSKAALALIGAIHGALAKPGVG